MNYDVIIVGGGIAGSTAAAYLSQSKYRVLLVEKEGKVGGLVSSFDYKGFKLDGGIRSIENSGIVMPMLKQLGIDVPFKRSIVTLGLGQDVIKVDTKESVDRYSEMLKKHYKDQTKDIDQIIKDIKKIMDYMDILYGCKGRL
jgi:phytoene dehydrogenase-like protein